MTQEIDPVLRLKLTEEEWERLKDLFEEVQKTIVHLGDPEEDIFQDHSLDLGPRDMESLMKLISDWNILRHCISSLLGKVSPWDDPHLEARAENLVKRERG